MMAGAERYFVFNELGENVPCRSCGEVTLLWDGLCWPCFEAQDATSPLGVLFKLEGIDLGCPTCLA